MALLFSNLDFATPHSSLRLFVQKIELEARNQVERLNNIRSGRVVVRELAEISINAVPLGYIRFK